MVRYRANETKQNIYSVANIAGLDCNNSPLNIADTQTPKAVNVIYDSGTVVKRKGNQVITVNNEDDGYFKVKTDYTDFEKLKIHSSCVLNESVVIAHAGTYIYVLEKRLNGRIYVVNRDGVKCKLQVADSSSFMVTQRNAAFVFINRTTDSNPSLVKVSQDEHGKWELKVLSDTDLYIPVTTSNIVASAIPLGSGTPSRTNFEPVNMLSEWRRNTILASNTNSFLYTSGSASDTALTVWNAKRGNLSSRIDLDGKATSYETVTMTVDYIDSECPGWNEIPSKANTITDIVKHAETSIVKTNAYQTSLTDGGKKIWWSYEIRLNIRGSETTIGYLHNPNDPQIEVYDSNGNVTDSTYTESENAYIILTVDLGNPLNGAPNITVKFKADIESQKDRIFNCRFAYCYQDGNNVSTLFVSGNDDYPNIDWHSSGTFDNGNAFSDYTYFPDIGYTALGNQNSRIIGYQLSNDGYLVTYKSKLENEPTIYLRKSSLAYVGTGIANEALYDLTFPVTQGISGETPENENCIVNFYNENLFFNKSGIYALALSENMVGTVRYSYPRATLISNSLQHEDFENAKAISYDNKLYIAFSSSGRCYVADTKNLVKVGANTEYQWWVYDNIHVQKFFILNNRLYYFNEYGQVVSFGESFEKYGDVQTINFNGLGSITYDVDNKVFQFDPTKASLTIRAVGMGERYYMENNDGKRIEVERMDLENGTVTLADKSLTEAEKTAFVTSTPILLHICKSVKAYLFTKPIFFDSLLVGKNVRSLMFTSGAYKETCECTVSVLTRNYEKVLSPSMLDSIDFAFDTLRFDKVFYESPSFDIKTCVRPLYLKNINALSLAFSNDNFTNMSISAIQFVYEYTQQLKE